MVFFNFSPNLASDKLIALFLLGILFLLIFGCAGENQSTENNSGNSAFVSYSPPDENGVEINPQVYNELPRDSCIKACLLEKRTRGDLSQGPCLGIIAVNYVCDVAHNPREDVDNVPENQCADYVQGRVLHYIEVDENCTFINEN